MPDKSDHKKAWQTSQRALQVARGAEASVSRLSAPAPLTLLQRVGLLGTIIGALIAIAGVLYRYYPTIEVRAVNGELSFTPTDARFAFRNVGRLPISDAIISCKIDTANH